MCLYLPCVWVVVSLVEISVFVKWVHGVSDSLYMDMSVSLVSSDLSKSLEKYHKNVL